MGGWSQALYPQQSWIKFSPGLAPFEIRRAVSTLAAWADGSAPRDASLSFALAGSGKPAPLRDLMEVPMSAWQNFGGHLLGQAVNAKALSRSSDDAAAQRSLQLVSEFLFRPDPPLSISAASQSSLPTIGMQST